MLLPRPSPPRRATSRGASPPGTFCPLPSLRISLVSYERSRGLAVEQMSSVEVVGSYWFSGRLLSWGRPFHLFAGARTDSPRLPGVAGSRLPACLSLFPCPSTTVGSFYNSLTIFPGSAHTILTLRESAYFRSQHPGLPGAAEGRQELRAGGNS